MKISEFKLLCEAFRLIDADGGHHVKLDDTKSVPAKWETAFEIAEAALESLKGKKLGSFVPKHTLRRIAKGGGMSVDEYGAMDAFESVVMPINDDAPIIMRAAGLMAEQVDATDTVLFNYFDGELCSLAVRNSKNEQIRRLRKEH
jgi:hypothetical protein